MTFTCTEHHSDGGVAFLEPVGDISTAAAWQLWLMISEAILASKPDELHISLDAVSDLSDPGVHALMSGYIVAIDYGTRYRVMGARNQVRAGLQALGILDALGDSDDLGALLLAVLTMSATGSARPGL